MIRFEVRLINYFRKEENRQQIKFQRTKVKEDLKKHGSNHYYSNAQTCNGMHLLKQQPRVVFWYMGAYASSILKSILHIF
jgi:hypothetical protein